MTKFQKIVSEYDNRLSYDVEVHNRVETWDKYIVDDIVQLCQDNGIKIFVQHFILSKSHQKHLPRYCIYSSKNILGNDTNYFDYNKGKEFYKIYDYYSELKEFKKSRRKHPIRNLKKYRVQRVDRIKQETVISFFKLNKGLE